MALFQRPGCEGGVGVGPMALAGEELSILYWATNLLDKGCYS